jgi:hypothetical protein
VRAIGSITAKLERSSMLMKQRKQLQQLTKSVCETLVDIVSVRKSFRSFFVF